MTDSQNTNPESEEEKVMKIRRQRLIKAISEEPIIASLMKDAYGFTVRVIEAVSTHSEIAGFRAADGPREHISVPGETEPFYYMHLIGKESDEEMGVMIVFDIAHGSDVVISFVDSIEAESVRISYALKHRTDISNYEQHAQARRIATAPRGIALCDLVELLPPMRVAGALEISQSRPARFIATYEGEILRPMNWPETK